MINLEVYTINTLVLVQTNKLFEALKKCFLSSDFSIKRTYLQTSFDWQLRVGMSMSAQWLNEATEIGYPKKLKLVHPKSLKSRKLTTLEGQAAMVHAIAHIEYNAIHLALDAIMRYANMPVTYYADWWQVAQEEGKHFNLLNEYLNQLGYEYGDFPAHNSLWELATETAYDVLARMALVPRIMEARGLDVTPGIRDKFQRVGCNAMVNILNIIFHDEIGHVAIGNHWFHWLCEQRSQCPMATFKQLIHQHVTTQIKGPFAHHARIEAGFSEEELLYLQSIG